MIQLLGSLHDEHGNTTIDGLNNRQHWTGVADMLWARPSATVLGIDVPHVIGSSAAIQASATARVSLRIPNGVGGQDAQDALVEHLQSRVPWGLERTIERVAVGDPFQGSLSGPGYESLKAGMEERTAAS